MSRAFTGLALAAALLAVVPPARAFDPAAFAFRPHPGASLPLAAPLRDEQGRAVTLGSYFTGKPVILLLDYLRCRTLCGVTLDSLVGALARLPLEPGRDFTVLAVSIDPRDTPADAAAAKAKDLGDYQGSDVAGGIHFLTGATAAVRPIADAVGFPYRYDRALDQYIHPAGFVVAAADGRISRYFFGIAVTPGELRGALADAVQHKTVGPLTRLLLLCHLAGVPSGYVTIVLAAFTLADLGATAAVFAVFAAIRRRRHG